MEQMGNVLVNNCSFEGLRPFMADLPYPPIQVREKNPSYANLLSIDYCGSVSELSAITQYINNENRLSCEKCPMARTLLGIAMAEMMHLQKLGELIVLLEYLDIPEQVKGMLVADIEAERAAINQYEVHMKMIKDDCVNAVLARIIEDEQYHIMLLRSLMNGNECMK